MAESLPTMDLTTMPPPPAPTHPPLSSALPPSTPGTTTSSALEKTIAFEARNIPLPLSTYNDTAYTTTASHAYASSCRGTVQLDDVYTPADPYAARSGIEAHRIFWPPTLPSPWELAKRTEEARTTARLLRDIIPYSALPEDPLVREFVLRTRAARDSMDRYMSTVAAKRNAIASVNMHLVRGVVEAREELEIALGHYERAVGWGGAVGERPLVAGEGSEVGTTEEGERHVKPLPPPVELEKRIHEALISAWLLHDMVQTDDAVQLAHDELAKEFAERCLAARTSMEDYIACVTRGNLLIKAETLSDMFMARQELDTALAAYEHGRIGDELERATDGERREEAQSLELEQHLERMKKQEARAQLEQQLRIQEKQDLEERQREYVVSEEEKQDWEERPSRWPEPEKKKQSKPKPKLPGRKSFLSSLCCWRF
ncbi:hypothetical protein EJ06DRAFT_549696 [Trichodelitschia bisporula]|uniref:Uncharacterized protein n=1 Tax=Trichodelitschia bisporula TaxID=703511 RepID=A0A6G1HUL5_9PEZI|nr:hypothetical protein EJ06DRAFT_549696 [Trichodelitschia bisporula]